MILLISFFPRILSFSPQIVLIEIFCIYSYVPANPPLLAKDAKEFLERRMRDCDKLWVRTEKDGKYGRMLGEIWCGVTNINEEMVSRGFAWEYDGGKKEKNLDDLRTIRGII